jgi:hypothetical protein
MHLYQETAADGDDDDVDDGDDGGEKKTVQVMEEETCVSVTLVAYIHDYTDDDDGEPSSLIRLNHQVAQIFTASAIFNENGTVASRRVFLHREPS